MANPNSAFGLRPSRSLLRGNAQVNEYAHSSNEATALFIGDPLVVDQNTDATGTTASTSLVPDGTSYVKASGTITTTPITGVVASVRPTLTNLTLQYGLASTEYGLLVYDDPFQLFEIMSNGTVQVDDVMDTMGITSGAGSTYTGISAYVATESTGHADNAYVLRIIRVSLLVNQSNIAANAILECKINLHALMTTTTP